MLKDSGIPSAGFELNRFRILVESLYPNGVCTWCYRPEAHNAQTTLEEERWRLIDYLQSRIDEYMKWHRLPVLRETKILRDRSQRAIGTILYD